MSASPPAADRRGYRRLWVFMVPYAPRLAAVIGISLVSTLLSLAQPYLSKLMIDDALLRRDMRMLAILAGVLFAATLLGFALGIAASYRYASLSAAMLFDMRVALLRHLQTLSPRFYGRFRLGDLLSRLNRDVGDVQRVTADTLLSVIGNVLFLVGSVALMLLLSWRLFLVGVVLVPLCLLAFAHYSRKLTPITREMRELGADVGSLFVDTIMGIRVVTMLQAGEHEAGRFRARNDAFVSAMLRLQTASFLTGAIPGAILAAATTAVILYGGWLILQDRLTIGTLVAFMAYHMRLLSPMQSLMGLAAALAAARVSLDRIFELLDTPPDVRESERAVPLDRVREGIRLDHVGFCHGREPVLVDVDVVIPHGVICAVLGPSGVGKSTLADLIARNLDPDGGRVLLDGRDVRDLRLADVRREVMLVDQSPYLFNDTIAANVGFASPGVGAAEIERAGRTAGLDELIARLPEGYATQVGERGLALSSGERQRIALARALLRRPSVLILDEPTAALDAETEALIASGLRRALPEATIIVITHKPALAAMADVVVTLAAGRSQLVARDRVAG